MRKTSKGFIDPMALGFLLSLLGSTLALAQDPGLADSKEQAPALAQTATAADPVGPSEGDR